MTSLHWQTIVSKTDNVMHFACLVEQASATRFCDLFVYGAYMVHRPGM